MSTPQRFPKSRERSVVGRGRKTVGAPAADRHRLRALVRRGSEDQHLSPLARKSRELPDGAICERCGAVYERRHWRAGTERERRFAPDLTWAVCPACNQVAAGEGFGRVVLHTGDSPDRDEAIRRRIRNVAARAEVSQPERRIVSIERRGEDIEVRTTSQRLAHRIVAALLKAFGGRGAYAWSHNDGGLQATWLWDESSGKGTARRGALSGARRGSRERAPSLDLRGRHVAIEPAWRTLVREQLDAWNRRYPGIVSLRVTLSRTRHHRQGVEEAAAQMLLAGRAVHAVRESETMTAALREMLRAIDRELSAKPRPRRATRPRSL
jgi:ribosome-associated translation inhibitor RaiA